MPGGVHPAGDLLSAPLGRGMVTDASMRSRVGFVVLTLFHVKHGEAGPFQQSLMSDVSSVLELVTDSQRCAARTVRGALLDRCVVPGGALPTYDGGSTLIEWSHRFT